MANDDGGDDGRHDPGESQFVGITRELVRTGAGLAGRDPDEVAERFDSVVDSVTGPDATASEVDDALRSSLSHAARSADESRGQDRADRLHVETASTGDDAVRVIADVPHDEASFKRGQKSIIVEAEDGRKRRVDLSFPLASVDVVSDSEDQHAEAVVAPLDPDGD